MGLIAAHILIKVKYSRDDLSFVLKLWFFSDEKPGNSEMTRKWMYLGFISQENYVEPEMNALPIYIEKERHPNFPHTDMGGMSR